LEAERRVARLAENQSVRGRRAADLAPERDRLTAEQATHAQNEAEAASEEERLLVRNEETREKRNGLQVTRTDKEGQLALVRVELETLHDSQRRAEVQNARAETRRAAAVEELLEQYGWSEADAIAQAPEVDLPENAASEANRLRREMRQMGEVNLGAIEAFDRLTQRHTELSLQAEDVEGGIAEINETIKELDRLTGSRFHDAFEQVNAAFGKTFAQLFPGGEAELRLLDPANALDSGVEIDVILPGKRKQNLELLSGGERSLSALAFLFALLRIKPTPLVVLDEVDAPLDGRNVERYVEMLKSESQAIQFLVITHNPVTIEAADIWFGVTMQEPGVSTLVPIRLAPSTLVEHVAEVVPAAFLH
jgi:chromosome segregation protein